MILESLVLFLITVLSLLVCYYVIYFAFVIGFCARVLIRVACLLIVLWWLFARGGVSSYCPPHCACFGPRMDCRGRDVSSWILNRRRLSGSLDLTGAHGIQLSRGGCHKFAKVESLSLRQTGISCQEARAWKKVCRLQVTFQRHYAALKVSVEREFY